MSGSSPGERGDLLRACVSRLAQSSVRAVDKGPAPMGVGPGRFGTADQRANVSDCIGSLRLRHGGESQTRQVRAWISHFSERKSGDYRPEMERHGIYHQAAGVPVEPMAPAP
jgi:hypothetical protein